MKNLVLYSTRSGNSQLIGTTIAKELDCEIINLNEAQFDDINLEEINTLFLGSGVYGGSLHKRIMDFGTFLNTKSFSRSIPLKVALFVTWLGRGKSDLSAINHFKEIVPSEKIIIQEDYFRCFGKSFGFIRKHNPDENDIGNAQKWAKKIASTFH